MRFNDKIVLVTGANFGIGNAIARKFAGEGAKIAIVARGQERSEKVVEAFAAEGFTADFFKTDVSDEKAVEGMIAAVLAKYGHIDVVVNNAGCGSQNCGITPDDSPGKRWAFFRGANLDSCYFVSAHALPHLSKNPGSAIVNISSTATLHGNWGLYGAAKAGVEGMTRSFAAEAAQFGTRVNCISPGWIETSPEQTLAAQGSETGEWDMPPSLLNRMGTIEEIANVAAFLASDDASFITGQTLVVDGGLTITDYPSRASLSTVGHRVFSRS
ncbi:SDR family NAD(P)-dependent oxidoreductase [Pseudohalocynthiibacter aestuariivivens]|jgi:NAD(P)-dependent dehydrogenase (short-subunit alcohol dehydrogenase family)|uniref:SDR family NAD(P)-dependent oxidoreductase n=1 Tax=Pseudohalocynthiibacter aestuariivivens TaxID=1591409 RepID=A0ABV5JAA7_9RHOB|nr:MULTISPECIES: SDR family NAD(P)-dependent oxidoreductase [Pseudohalocynthiibacter]MBS9716044.1 SDR family oxidoreductase [Pseudohalocynthiibacter aestuariivivens]MCK0102398.1 SDR family oxidoreductase [Pseudohalocynthiibacter sp. F2068]